MNGEMTILTLNGDKKENNLGKGRLFINGLKVANVFEENLLSQKKE